MLQTAIAQIARLQPEQLPHVGLPAVPDLAAARPLADIAHGNAAPLLAAARVAAEDRSTIEAALGKARRLIGATLGDLLRLGIELLQRGFPVALRLLIPVPAVRAAALAKLRSLASQYVARAVQRVKQLAGELLQAAAPLLPIAQRAVQAAVRGSQPDNTTVARHALPATASTEIAEVSEANVATPVAAHAPADSSGSTQGRAAVQAAMSQVGTPYVWGGTGAGGFDCSGLTQWAWRQAGVELPRTAESQAVGRQVSAAELQPGDLVVWDGHVAMYSGDGQMVEAGSPVQTNPLRTNNMGMAFKGFWRPTG